MNYVLQAYRGWLTEIALLWFYLLFQHLRFNVFTFSKPISVHNLRWIHS